LLKNRRRRNLLELAGKIEFAEGYNYKSLRERKKIMILVDTSVLIDFFKGKKNNSCQKFELLLNQGIPFGINSFIFQEVLQGAKSDKEYRMLKKYLETQRFYHLNDPIVSFAKAARIYFDCQKKWHYNSQHHRLPYRSDCFRA